MIRAFSNTSRRSSRVIRARRANTGFNEPAKQACNENIKDEGSVIFQASNQLHSIKNVGQTQATYHVLKWVSPGSGDTFK